MSSSWHHFGGFRGFRGLPGMNSKQQEKRVIYNTKLTLAIQEFTKIRLSRMPAPRWCLKGPRWSREVPWGTLGFPWAPLWSLLRPPRTHPGVPLARPGSIWGLTETLWGSPGGHRGIQLYKKLPINRQSGHMLLCSSHMNRNTWMF